MRRKQLLLILTLVIVLVCSSCVNIGNVVEVPAYPAEGVTVEVQEIDDYHCYAIYTNTTDEAVSLITDFMCFTKAGTPVGYNGGFGKYVKPGEMHIDFVSTTDPYDNYQVDCAKGELLDSVVKLNEALTMESKKNPDGSVTVHFTSDPEGSSATSTIYYFDADGRILGHSYDNPSFYYDMGGTFAAPNFEYASYYIEYEASSIDLPSDEYFLPPGVDSSEPWDVSSEPWDASSEPMDASVVETESGSP